MVGVFPGGSAVKYRSAMQETGIQFLGQEDPREKKMQLTPVFLPGKSHGQRSLTGYIVYGLAKQSNTT